ncbi:MAG: hypothetical protein IKP73_03330 [Bacteroidales bacterium]|nr:hypothetical protein [Bacteroidales bacterium]
MSKKGKESYFWTSYSDLMTSLFFIMLVLFVLIIVVLHNYNKKNTAELEAKNKKLEELTAKLEEQKKALEIAYGEVITKKETMDKINQMELQFQDLVSSGLFEYNEVGKKFIVKKFKGKEIFKSLSSEIQTRYINDAIDIGKELEKLLQQLCKHQQFKYQLVIEGNCANDDYKSMSKDSQKWYKLSYERALALYNLWQDKGIDLRKYNTEIMICGSGLNGNDRDPVEAYNKRFVIQIIPKIKPFTK